MATPHRLFHLWLAAVNSGDASLITSFFDQHGAALPPHQLDKELSYWRTGGLDLRRTDEDSARIFSALVQDRAQGSYARAVLEMEPDAGPGLRRFSVQYVTDLPDAEPERLSEAQALAELDARLSRCAASDSFSGAVLVTRGGETVFSRACGLRDRARGIANAIDTRFCIASMGKMLTGVAAVQLVQAGKIDFEEPLIRYVPDYPDESVAAQLRVGQLLNHTGGTGDIFVPETEAIREKKARPADYMEILGTRPLRFVPGSDWEYSNYGFMLAGLVIERASGQTYDDYVAEHIFRPAAMDASSFDAPDGHAVHYSRSSVRAPWEPWSATGAQHRGTPAGGAYSTVTDIARFASALVRNELLDAAHTELATTGNVPARGGRYGYGFGEHTIGGVRWFGHGGGSAGVNGELRIYPQSGYVVVALANLDPPAAVAMSAFVGDRLPAAV